MSDEETLNLTVSSEEVALEVGYGLLGRAKEIHNNPDDDHEPVAEELKETAWEIIDQYENPEEAEA